MKHRQIIWKSLAYEGLEHVYISKGIAENIVKGCFIGVIEQKGFQFSYMLSYDKSYRIIGVDLSLWREESLHLRSDRQGNWKQYFGTNLQPLPQFAGCLDIDITATPFTNTLPIRRVQWEVGQSRDFKMLYITVPELTLSVSEQRYTCLEKSEAGGSFRFELVDGSFSADLPVDADGLVLDYPGLFKRLWAS